jgi:cytochrome c5
LLVAGSLAAGNSAGMGSVMRNRVFVLIGMLVSAIGMAYGFGNSELKFSRVDPIGEEAVAIFKNRCVKCHLADGTGKESYTPDFTDAKWQATKKNEELTSSITDGLNDMPAFGDILSKDEIKGMVGYVRSLAKSGK